MTEPEQVSVNVADLRIQLELDQVGPVAYHDARERLVAAVPEPEWEPTDEQVAQYRRAMHWIDDDHMARTVDLNLQAMHREGLIP